MLTMGDDTHVTDVRGHVHERTNLVCIAKSQRSDGCSLYALTGIYTCLR